MLRLGEIPDNLGSYKQRMGVLVCNYVGQAKKYLVVPSNGATPYPDMILS